MKTKKLAVVGYGQRGSIYANYALQNPEEFVVTAIVDNDENRRKLAASKHDCPVFSDYREFLAAGIEADLVAVATQDKDHREHAIACMEAGYDLLLEKPIATSLEDCEAYKGGDTEGLRRLAEGEYTRLEESVSRFTEAFEYQWNKENKPYGLEVHQYRLGGLVARIKACKKRIYQYIDGEISEIPELCDEILTFLAEGESGYFNKFTGNITANIM